MIFSKDMDHDDLINECLLNFAADFEKYVTLMVKLGFNVKIVWFKGQKAIKISYLFPYKPYFLPHEKVSLAERCIWRWTARGLREG